MTTHAQNGSIPAHARNAHKLKIKTQQIVEYDKVIYHSKDKMELILAEALLFKEYFPHLNNQTEEDMRILKIF